jgi:hypothetical protein
MYVDLHDDLKYNLAKPVEICTDGADLSKALSSFRAVSHIYSKLGTFAHSLHILRPDIIFGERNLCAAGSE